MSDGKLVAKGDMIGEDMLYFALKRIPYDMPVNEMLKETPYERAVRKVRQEEHLQRKKLEEKKYRAYPHVRDYQAVHSR